MAQTKEGGIGQMDPEEVFYSGFCKALNETRTVLCEFDEEGALLSADCAYGNCPHSLSCRLMEPVREREGEGRL